MGQLFAVIAPTRHEADGLLEAGLAAFRSIHGIRPSSQAAAGQGIRIARFRAAHGGGTEIVRNVRTPDVAAAVGGWMFGSRQDGGALRAAAEAILDGGDRFAAESRGLDGYFAILAARGEGREIVLVTDRVGGLHVCWTVHAGATIVSTSSAVLAAVTGAGLDGTGVRHVLATGSVFGERTLWRDIQKAPAASVLRFAAGGSPRTERWWRIGDHAFDAAEPRSIADLAEALVDAERSLFATFRNPVFDLTGGLDSRNLLAAAMRTGCRPSTVVNGRADLADPVVAGRIARELGLDHRNQQMGVDFRVPEFRDFERVAALGDGEANVFEYAATMLAQERTAESGFDVAVNGSWGELCRGYWWDLVSGRPSSAGGLDAMLVTVRRFVPDTFADDVAPALDAPFAAVAMHTETERALADVRGRAAGFQADVVYARMRMQRWAGRIASLTSRLRPCAAPFMFRRPLEAVLAIPPKFRTRDRGARSLIELLSPSLAAMPTDSGAPAGPIRPWNAHRYAPLAGKLGRAAVRRLRGAAAAPDHPPRAGDIWRLPEITDLLDVRTLHTAPLYDRAALAALIERSRASRDPCPSTLGRIVTLELVHRAVERARSHSDSRAATAR